MGNRASDDSYEPVIRGYRVSGFRSLRDIEVRCPGKIIVVCGPNNVGKSSLLVALQAYREIVGAFSGRGIKQVSSVLAAETSSTASVAIDLRGSRLQAALAEVGGVDEARFDDMGERLTVELGDDLLWFDFRARDGKLEFDKTCLEPLSRLLLEWWRSRDRTLRDWATYLARLGDSTSDSTLGPPWAAKVGARLLPSPEIRHITDVRRLSTHPLGPDDLKSLVVAAGHTTEQPPRKREEWARQLEHVLQDVFGADVRYEASPTTEGPGELRLAIDGETDVLVDHVGAGVREVIAISFQALGRGGADVLCIEEPENCLHPSAVRRLIHSLANQADVQLFVTTHSAAVINSDPDMVIELTRTSAGTRAHAVTDAATRFHAVQALGHSPADLVLSRCAVWVEGPSDRLYLTTWLSHESLTEGTDYHIVFYGGALGTHLTALHDPSEDEFLAQVRPLSRRCVLVADTDRDKANGALKQHVTRWREEIRGDSDAAVLLTWGREIENSLPLDVVNKIRVEHNLRTLPSNDVRFVKIFDPGLTKRLKKLQFARRALELAGDSTPEGARKLIHDLAVFIRASKGIE